MVSGGSVRIEVNSISGICLTKLDVLDGLEEVKQVLATNFPMKWLITYRAVMILPQPSRSTKPCRDGGYNFGMTRLTKCRRPRKNIKRLGELVGAPIDIVSTGPDQTNDRDFFTVCD